MFDTMDDKLEKYHKLSKEDKDNLTYYNIFKSIYCFAPSEATSIEVTTIANASYEAWRKCEEEYSVEKFSDYLAEHYFNGDITLDTIRNASRREIIDLVIFGDEIESEKEI